MNSDGRVNVYESIIRYGGGKSVSGQRVVTSSNVFNSNGTIRYYDDNLRLHRDGGPAIIRPDGEEVWARHGRFHRDDGPAMITFDGREMWYVDGLRTDVPKSIQHLWTPE
jgi:flagellar basal body rod protein FlgG